MIRSLHRLAAHPILFSGLLVLATPSCASSPAPSPAEATPVAGPADQDQPEAPAATGPREAGRAILHTSEGPITITMYPDVAPRTTSHIMDLLQAGCYDGVDFFRLEPKFVVQVSAVSDEACHPDAKATVPLEISEVPHERSSLSMARFDDPESGTSSWSVVLAPSPSLDGVYTVFGRVVEGEDTIQAIEAIGAVDGKNGMHKPERPVIIERVEVLEPLAAE